MLFKLRWQDTSGMRDLDGTVFHFDPGKPVGCYCQVALKGFLLAQSKHCCEQPCVEEGNKAYL